MNRPTATFSGATAGAAPQGLSAAATNCGAILALDLGTTTGWALSQPLSNDISHGWISFKPNRFEGGGMRFLRFTQWLSEMHQAVVSRSHRNALGAVYFEEVRRHLGVDAAHAYGGFLATLTGWCEREGIAYQGVPVGTIKRHATGKGNASKELVIGAMRAKGHAVSDDNEADALALLHCVLAQGGSHG